HEAGGQQAWLGSVLCTTPTTPADNCRAPGEQALVVSNTPTYSYGPGTTTDTQTDATSFETLLFQDKVNAVVSGRLGWNGLYYATAPGLHCPQPGGDYPAKAPDAQAAGCGSAAAVPTDPNAAAAALADALHGLGAPAPPAGTPGLPASGVNLT